MSKEKDKKEDDEEFISIAKAAKKLNVSEGTIRRYFDKGILVGELVFQHNKKERQIYESSVIFFISLYEKSDKTKSQKQILKEILEQQKRLFGS